MPKKKHTHDKILGAAHVIDVNMGYGHSRPAHVLRYLSDGNVLSANDYEGIPQKDRKAWVNSRKIYEKVSRLKPIPVLGDIAFGVMDSLQQIPDFYPRRDLSRPNLQLRQIYSLIKNGFGRHLIDQLAKNPLPIVTTFFIPAFMADHFDYPGDIYCITTDADISRTWAPLHPKRSRIKYFASNGRVKERLQLYGVPEKNIYLTGFPLPKELIGSTKSDHLKEALAKRLCNLDPEGIFHDRYAKILRAELGSDKCRIVKAGHPLTLSYMIGGAGAQRKLAVQIMHSLRGAIKRGQIQLNLLPGTRANIAKYFQDEAKALGLKRYIGKSLHIHVSKTRAEYFSEFNEVLKTTDIIWTKPSEMSFYTGLGYPIIMADPIGSQEDFNKVWLQYVGGGVAQADPRYTNEWLFDWINSGGIARMAWNGYIEAPTHGAYRIEDTVLGRAWDIHPLPMIV